MKTLILLLLLSVAFTAEAQVIKRDSDYSKRLYKDSCKCYLAKDPKSAQINPYAFADSVRLKKTVDKTKKKRNNVTN